ncbi:RICIN domain-containing protein [Streptomyces daliensis]|uniref:RICIN domain-containing protein n=1 Tax=Streptomyces daliensis TaxID=299421 RepID=A0A8T4IQI7_9ACTN|nr:RICIN domain-containing protein [Streptomyces daliensis]
MRHSCFRVAMATAAALAGVLVGSGSAQAAPGDVPSEPSVLTNHAYDNYLVPDDTVGNPGTFLQVYYADDNTIPRTFTFERVSGHSDIYKWKSAKTGSCAETQGNGKAGTSVLLQKCGTNKAQWWVVRPVGGTSDQFVISPYNDEDLAVTGLFGNDNYAPLRPLPSSNTSTAAQRWHINPE